MTVTRESLARVQHHHGDDIARIVDEAPLPPPAALELMRAMGCPAAHIPDSIPAKAAS